jgi:hypothetical protein
MHSTMNANLSERDLALPVSSATVVPAFAAELDEKGENMASKREHGREQASEQARAGTPPEPDAHAGWLTRHEVARALEISLISVRRRQASGELTGELVDGQWRFPPEAVDAIAETLEGEREPKSATATATSEAGSEAKVLFGAAVSLARQAEAHNERLLALIEAPASRLLEQTTREAGALRKRIAELEQKHTALVEAAQAALDRAHERQLHEKEQQAKLALRFEALEALKQWAPVLAGRIFGARGEKGTANQVFSEGLPSSLSEDQVLKLFDSGILTEAQCAMLVSVVQNLAAERAKGQADGAQNGRPSNEGQHRNEPIVSPEGGA